MVTLRQNGIDEQWSPNFTLYTIYIYKDYESQWNHPSLNVRKMCFWGSCVGLMIKIKKYSAVEIKKYSSIKYINK